MSKYVGKDREEERGWQRMTMERNLNMEEKGREKRLENKRDEVGIRNDRE